MRIASVSENLDIEKRIAITPEIAKKYIDLGIEVSLSKNYATHLGINDSKYSDLGVVIIDDEKEAISNADIIVQLNLPSDDKCSLIKENKTISIASSTVILKRVISGCVIGNTPESLCFLKKGITEPFDHITFQYLTTENHIS